MGRVRLGMSFQLTVDCSDPDVLARFWAVALNYELESPPGGFTSWWDYWASVGVPEDELVDGYDSIVHANGPRIWFQQVPEQKSNKNRFHFDVLVGGGRSIPIEERTSRVRSKSAALVALGATVLAENSSPEVDHFFIAMSDPEGNEFDVV